MGRSGGCPVGSPKGPGEEPGYRPGERGLGNYPASFGRGHLATCVSDCSQSRRSRSEGPRGPSSTRVTWMPETGDSLTLLEGGAFAATVRSEARPRQLRQTDQEIQRDGDSISRNFIFQTGRRRLRCRGPVVGGVGVSRAKPASQRHTFPARFQHVIVYLQRGRAVAVTTAGGTVAVSCSGLPTGLTSFLMAESAQWPE